MRTRCNSITNFIKKTYLNPLTANVFSSIGSGLIFLVVYNILKKSNEIYCRSDCSSNEFIITNDRIQDIVSISSLLIGPTFLINLILNYKIIRPIEMQSEYLISNNSNFRDLITKTNLKYAAKLSCPAILGITPSLIWVFSNSKNPNLEDIFAFSLGFIIKHIHQNHALYKELSSKIPTSTANINYDNNANINYYNRLAINITETQNTFQINDMTTITNPQSTNIFNSPLPLEIYQPNYNLSNESEQNNFRSSSPSSPSTQTPIHLSTTNTAPQSVEIPNTTNIILDSQESSPQMSSNRQKYKNSSVTSKLKLSVNFEDFNNLSNQNPEQIQLPRNSISTHSSSSTTPEQIQLPRNSISTHSSSSTTSEQIQPQRPSTPRPPSSHQLMRNTSSKRFAAIV